MKQCRILLLEDSPVRVAFFQERFGSENVVHVTTVGGAVTAARNGEFDIVFLDHDLGTRETGYDFVKSVVANDLCRNAVFFCHSDNVIGRSNMASMLSSAGYNTRQQPFCNLLREFGGE